MHKKCLKCSMATFSSVEDVLNLDAQNTRNFQTLQSVL